MIPLISICVPAYKRVHYLKRLLDSIALQSFTEFEVVITDDSKDDAVKGLIHAYDGSFPILYYRNAQQLGTPENWNEGIRRARGEWIKVMHDDDWFASPSSLAEFATSTRSGKNFIFSAYQNVYEDKGRVELVRASRLDRRILTRDPAALLARNLVGPPSVTLYRKKALQFDKRMKWRVDIDFYIHYLRDCSFEYIDKPLIKIGISREQVTQSAFLVPEVELPENFLLLDKVGTYRLKNWLAYDSWWRLLRNLNIRSIDQIRKSGYAAEIPPLIQIMLRDQLQWPPALLKVGVFSKTFMFISYFRRLPLMK